METAGQVAELVSGFLAAEEPWLVAGRRYLHAQPELGHAEHRTTELVRNRLASAGLTPKVLSGGTGLLCDIGIGDGPLVALRADLDALPLADEKDVPYRSTVPGVCHACGHDVHTTVLLGAGLALAHLADAGWLPGRVRLIFQPAEELTPGGAVDVVEADGLDGVQRIFALHCDPRTDAGQAGLRSGPITAAADRFQVRLRGPGGHTSRPHLTADLVYALAKVVTEVPAALSRRGGFRVVPGEGAWLARSARRPLARLADRHGPAPRDLRRGRALDRGRGAGAGGHRGYRAGSGMAGRGSPRIG